MRSHLITNFFLLLLAIGLGVFLFVDDTNQNGIKKLSNISVNSINQISIHHNQRDIIINKVDKEWRIVKPMAISANQFRIGTLLSLLDSNSHAKYVTDDLDLKKYGLEKIKTFISFNDFKIDFGSINPINNLRYVKINNELHLTDDNFYPLLSSQLGALVALKLVPAKEKIFKLVLPEQTLTRDKKGLWKSTKEISSDAIVETIYQWNHKQAFAVHDYVVRESLGEIKVYLENTEAPILFNITDVDPWLIIARPDIKLEYHFDLENYDILLQPGSAKPLPEDPDAETIQVSPDKFMDAIQPQ